MRQARKVLEQSWKQTLEGNSGRTSKEPECLDSEEQTHELSDDNRNSIRDYTEDACYILQIICLGSVYMRIWVKLNLKVMD